MDIKSILKKKIKSDKKSAPPKNDNKIDLIVDNQIPEEPIYMNDDFDNPSPSIGEEAEVGGPILDNIRVIQDKWRGSISTVNISQQ